MEINIGISEDKRREIATGLEKVLADSYMLYLKTQNYHWNVKGQLFHQLHVMFEEQYTELAAANDVIAERIRTLGFRAPGTFTEFAKLTSVSEEVDQLNALEMVKRLALANETVLSTARNVLKPASEANDEATVDLITQKLNQHSKSTWMLRSFLEE